LIRTGSGLRLPGLGLLTATVLSFVVAQVPLRKRSTSLAWIGPGPGEHSHDPRAAAARLSSARHGVARVDRAQATRRSEDPAWRVGAPYHGHAGGASASAAAMPPRVPSARLEARASSAGCAWIALPG